MTDLKFHFDDGSEAIAHYGKKGMHWGVWDENTQEKYAANPDLIGEFAKLLNGGGSSPKPVYKGKNPYDVHAYNQSYQDRQKMNPVEAGARNIATVAGHHAKNLASEAGRGFDKFAKDSGLAEVSRKARNAATEIGKNAESAARSAAYNANKIASQASKSLSSAGSRALESGARVVDDIFGTSYSKRSKLRDARKRRRHQDVVEKQQRAHKQSMEMREQRTHENAMKRKNTADQAKRDRARSNREKYDWAQSRKHAKGMEKANAKDQAKRDRAMTKYKQRKTAEDILYRNAERKDNERREKTRKKYRKQQEGKAYTRDMTNRLNRNLGWSKDDRSSKAMNQARKKNIYKLESRDNYTESGMSDPKLSRSKSTQKFYKTLQNDTDALYGKRGKAAQKKAYKRRVRRYKKIGRGIAGE